MDTAIGFFFSFSRSINVCRESLSVSHHFCHRAQRGDEVG
jgi:hypothetical protein